MTIRLGALVASAMLAITCAANVHAQGSSTSKLDPVDAYTSSFNEWQEMVGQTAGLASSVRVLTDVKPIPMLPGRLYRCITDPTSAYVATIAGVQNDERKETK